MKNGTNKRTKTIDMKSNRQYRDSMTNFSIGAIGIALILIVVLVLKSTSPQKQEYQDIETELLNEIEMHWDTINKESKDWTGTTQEERQQRGILEQDWVCGDDYHDTVPRYSNFNDVPAGTQTLIMVDDILYKMNNNKTLWTPVYPDEYIMWIGSNGDTIWEHKNY